MFEIKNVNENNIEDAKSFLSSVPSITDIDEGVVKNAILLYENNKMAGIISYEPFSNYALIRYFIFKRDLSDFIIRELFANLVLRVKEQNISYLFSIVNEPEIADLFSSLDFYELNDDKVFIEEKSLEDLNLNNTRLMIKSI